MPTHALLNDPFYDTTFGLTSEGQQCSSFHNILNHSYTFSYPKTLLGSVNPSAVYVPMTGHTQIDRGSRGRWTALKEKLGLPHRGASTAPSRDSVDT